MTADPIRIFDSAAIRRHRDRAAAAEADFLFEEGAERLVERLSDVTRGFACALDLGCRNGAMGRRLAGRHGIEILVAADPGALCARRADGMSVVAEPEFLPFAEQSFDLVVSNLALHWVNDLPGALLQLCRALKPDGLLLASLFVGATLGELRESLLIAEAEIEGGAGPRVSPFADPADLAGLLQRAGFALPVVDIERIDTTYPDALKLMRELRQMGETNATIERRQSFTRRETLLRAGETYRARFGGDDGRIPATFEIATLTAWAPQDARL